MNKLYTLLLLALFSNAAFAQNTVTGIVRDAEDNTGLIGVTVLIEGTTSGTITDIEGRYTLKANPSDKLVFSYIGYVPMTVDVGNQTNIDIALKLDIAELEEVVVVGYGSLKKTEIIGSVASIKSDDITKIQNANFVEGMQGRAAGLRIGSSSGVPGAAPNIRIRGDNSISVGTSPLWIIDGVPIYSGGGLEGGGNGATSQDPLSLINPNDIESVEVLKDAAATAIYGSRGSSGVILVTTKSGKKGTSTTNVNITTGITQLSKSPEEVGFTNSSQWFDLIDEARANSGVPGTDFIGSTIGTFRDNPQRFVTEDQARQIDTDWFDLILQNGYFQEYNVSNTQGTEKLKSFFSLNYREDESVLINNNLRRFTGRTNLDFNITNDITLGTKLTYSSARNNRVSSGSGPTGAGGFSQANREALPWFPIYDPTHPSGYWNPRSRMNLMAIADTDLYSNNVNNYRGIGLVYGEFNIPWIEGLKLRSEFSFDALQTNGTEWISETLRVNESDGTRANDRSATSNRINYNTFLTYSKTFGESSSLTVVAGTESQRNRLVRRDIQAQNITGIFQEIGAPNTPVLATSRLVSENYLRAYFGRANYTLKGKYLFGLSARYDGVSKFNEENRWAFFPAVSAGWIISDEAFMSGISNTFNLLKLRGSFGITGNQAIPNNVFATSFNNSPNTRYGELNAIGGGTNVIRLGNPNITWETTESYDLGIDFGVFNNRLSGYFAYYYQYVRDLLLQSQIPPSTGTVQKNIFENVGEIENYGVELQLTGVIVDRKKFDWNANFNFTTNQTQVLSLTPELDASGGAIPLGNRRAFTGQENKVFFMAMDAGVDPQRGVNTIWELDRDHFNATGETRTTGRKIPATSTNLAENRFYHKGKSGNPAFFGGLGSDFKYGNWDFNFQFVFEFGRYFYDYNMQRTTDPQRGQVVTRTDLIGNTWTIQDSINGTSPKYPELAFNGIYPWDWDLEAEVITEAGDTLRGDWVRRNGNYKNEPLNWSKYLFRGDFVRLRSVQIGYTIPVGVLERLKLKYARVFFTGNNLLTFTKYESWDPETGGSAIPPLRSYVLGLNVRF